MLRSKVVVASQNKSLLKASGGHLGSTPAQMSIPSVNPGSFIQDSQLCGSDRRERVVVPLSLRFFFFLFFFSGRYFRNRKFLRIISDDKDNLNLFVPEENMGDQTLLVGLVRKSNVFLSSPRG